MFRPSEQLRLHALAIAGTQRVPVAPGNDNRSHLDASSGRVASRLSIALAQQNNPALSSALARAIARARRGFTFTEVMFAVIILGVGFVMIAAILPVAIQQSKSNVDDATGAAVALEAVNSVSNSPANAPAAATPVITTPPTTLFPPTSGAAATKGRVYYFGETAQSGTVGSPGEMDNTANINATPNTYFQPYEQINALIGQMIYPNDSRFGWVGFYQRDLIAAAKPAPFAKLTVLTMQSRLKTNYTLDFTQSNYDFPFVSSSPPPIIRVDATHPVMGTFRPKQVYVYLTERIDQPDLLTFVPQTGGTTAAYEPRAAEGAFVIIAVDPTAAGARPSVDPTYAGMLNGKVYRLGQPSAQFPGSWELQPGYDMAFQPSTASPPYPGYNENIPYVAVTMTSPSSNYNFPPTALSGTKNPAGTPATAFIVGRGLPNGAAAEDDDSTSWTSGGGSNIPTGPAQDVSVYQCIVPIPQ